MLNFLFKFMLGLSLVLSSGVLPCVYARSVDPDLNAAFTYIKSVNLQPAQQVILIDSREQLLHFYDKNHKRHTYVISTSKYGLGQKYGSYKTPVGLHQIIGKFGHRAHKHAIFRSREFTGVIWHRVPWSPAPAQRLANLVRASYQQGGLPTNSKSRPMLSINPKKDYIVGRILQLKGLEPGLNSGRDRRGNIVDSKQRAIYLHGTTMSWKLGSKATIGCVHLSPEDIIELFDLVNLGAQVLII